MSKCRKMGKQTDISIYNKSNKKGETLMQRHGKP